jgi:excisionase family DNA binding protein
MTADHARAFMAHLAIAVTQHEKGARRSALVVPAELLALRDIALTLATARQEPPPMESPTQPVKDDDMAKDALLLTKRDASALLRVSVRTVERLIASGSLRTVTVSASPRIRRSDLEAYVNSLTTAPADFSEGIVTKETA